LGNLSRGKSSGEGCGPLRAHLELGLVGAAAEFGGRLSADEASTEEPLIALVHVIGVGIRDGSLWDSLLRALSLHFRNCRKTTENENEYWQRTKKTKTGHEDLIQLFSMETRQGRINAKAL
jgi:hypothetical protein